MEVSSDNSSPQASENTIHDVINILNFEFHYSVTHVKSFNIINEVLEQNDV